MVRVAEADCDLCRVAGYRECDRCGGPVFPAESFVDEAGRDLCGYCAGVAAPS